ncbi:hypothetical protein [Actinomadura craniellae]|nr:hypothetical protein [Actinomadura craniellae]
MIEAEFTAMVPEIFGDRLGFAFVFGGFGKGYGGWNHDIDMFVAVDLLPTDDGARFISWYFDLHRRLGLPPDHDYPGELVALDDLDRRLALLESRRIRGVIETQYEYEAILWADALIERKLGVVRGPAITQDGFEHVLERAARLGARWRTEIRAIRSESPEELDRLDLRRLFKGHVRYLKGPGI